MDALFQPLASAVGASADQIKLITCLLVSYPLGSVFIRIPPSAHALKHVFNISISLFYLLPMLNLWGGFLQLLADVLGTYLITKYVSGPRMPWIVFFFIMGHLTANHVIRAIYEFGYETFDITGPQMVLAMQLTTFSWNVWDGRRSLENLDKWQSKMRVAEMPSLLEFLGFSFFFPGVLVGPYITYNDYKALINGSLFKSENEDKASQKTRLVPDGRKRVAYRKGLMGLIYLGFYVAFYPKYNYSVSLDPWFASLPIIYRVLLFQAAGVCERSKYYAIWTLTEGASIVTGYGFTGYDSSGRSLWEGAANVKALAIELPENFKVLLDSWNMRTNVWLRECIYKRVTPAGKKPGFRSSMTTFITSAFWHGIAPGYYLTFVMGGFVTTVGRLCRANIRPLVLPAPGSSSSLLKRAYDVVSTVCSILLLNYIAGPFMLQTLANCLNAWHVLGWYGHWMLAAAFLFFYGGGARYLKGLQKQQAEKAAKRPTVSRAPTQNGDSLMLPPMDQAVQEIEKKLD